MVHTCNPGIQDAETLLSLGYMARLVSNKNKIHQLKKNQKELLVVKPRSKQKGQVAVATRSHTDVSARPKLVD